jgi:hypothetical protein
MVDEIALTEEQKSEIATAKETAISEALEDNPDLTEKEQEEIGKQAEADALTKIGSAAGEGEKEDLSWLDTKKYGSDILTATKKQAQAYTGAVREMQKKQQEAAIYKKQVEELENKLLNSTSNTTTATAVDDYPEEFKRQLEEKYNNEYTFNQLRAMDEIVGARIAPLAEIIFNSQAEMVKNKFAQNKYYERYKDDIETRIEKLPLQDKVKPRKIQEVINQIIIEKFPEIIAEERENALREITGNPAKIPKSESTTTSGQTSTSSSKKTPILTKEQREYTKRTGGNPDELEEWLRVKDTAKKTGWDSYLA